MIWWFSTNTENYKTSPAGGGTWINHVQVSPPHGRQAFVSTGNCWFYFTVSRFQILYVLIWLYMCKTELCCSVKYKNKCTDTQTETEPEDEWSQNLLIIVLWLLFARTSLLRPVTMISSDCVHAETQSVPTEEESAEQIGRTRRSCLWSRCQEVMSSEVDAANTINERKIKFSCWGGDVWVYNYNHRELTFLPTAPRGGNQWNQWRSSCWTATC